MNVTVQLEAKEEEALQEIEEKKKDYEKNILPELKKTVDGLERQIDTLKDQLKVSPSDELEFTYDTLVAEHKKTSCKLYFPDSVHRLTSGGIYFAVDDFWLENINGKFDLELLPAMGSDVGQLVFVLSGQQDQPGVSGKFHMTNFKLKGDSLLVPSLNFDDMDVEVVFTVTIVLSFNSTLQKWIIKEDDFKIDILEFEGPFGLTKGVISAILSIVTPLVKRQVLKELPVEFGAFIVVLPCPLQVNGTFQADGQPYWDEVISPLVTSTNICSLMQQTPSEVLHFQAIQKSMQRRETDTAAAATTPGKLLTTLNELIGYHRTFQKTSCWPMMAELWQDAALAYYARTCKFEPSDTADDPSEQAFPSCLSMDKIFEGVARATKMPVGVHVDVLMVEGQYGIKNMIEQSNLFAKRMIQEMSKTQKDKIEKLTTAEHQLLESMQKMVLKNTDVFEFLLQRVDFMQGKSSVHVESGPAAELTGTFDSLSGQFPVALWTALPANKIIGGNIIVPTLTKLHTSKEGVLSFKFFELASLEMLEKCNLHKWFQDDLPEEAALSAVELAELNIHRPLFSFIMDEPVAMQPGAALFTVQVGPQEQDWVPDGATKQPEGARREKYLADIKPLGEACPILVQTSQQIKMLGKVPKVTTSVHLAALVKFLNHHFDDLDVLLDVISLTSGAKRETCMQYINFTKIVLGILTKYILKPGLELYVNMSTRVVANAMDIIVCLENRVPATSAVDLKAKIDFREILGDLSTLKSALFNAINHKSIIF